MKFIDTDEGYPEIPKSVACCPICGDQIVIEEIDEWEIESGKVTGCGLKINCISEPDIDSNEWNDWFNGHWSMPYVDWMPLEMSLKDWFNKNYRVKNLDTQLQGIPT